MNRHLHFDCFSGISGDMVLGALVSAGLSWTDLLRGLKGLKLTGYQLRKQEVQRGALHAIKVHVVIHQGFHRPLPISRIRKILSTSTLPDFVKQRSLAVFDRLADAEGLAHRVDAKDVHFHEVGVIDSFIDVVGGVLGCYLLNATRITASPINVGSGSIQTSHGLLPVPGPAVAALTTGIPMYSDGPRLELATPTGVALLRTLASEFGPMPTMTSMKIGHGAGDQNPDGWPNVLRVFVQEEPETAVRSTERIVQLDANLDDLNPQTYDHVMEQLFAAGAVDVTLTPIIMKKSRPGVLLSCLTAHSRTGTVLDILFRETTTLGVRLHDVARQVLPRRFVPVKLRGGIVQMKVAQIGTGLEKAAPEYADCLAIAIKTGRPLKDIQEEAVVTYRQSRSNMKQ